MPLDEDEAAAPPPERTGSRKEAAYQIYRDLILENIEYDTLTQNPRIDREQLDEIVDILLETVCTNRKSIRVAGDDYPCLLYTSGHGGAASGGKHRKADRPKEAACPE